MQPLSPSNRPATLYIRISVLSSAVLSTAVLVMVLWECVRHTVFHKRVFRVQVAGQLSGMNPCTRVSLFTGAPRKAMEPGLRELCIFISFSPLVRMVQVTDHQLYRILVLNSAQKTGWWQH